MLIVPLVCLPIALVVDRLSAKPARVGALTALGLLFVASATIQVAKHAFGWARAIQPPLSELATAMQRGGMGPVVWRMLGWLFPHPVAALAILVAGLGTADWLRGESVRRSAALSNLQQESGAAGGEKLTPHASSVVVSNG
jgi:hypothetical protein